MNLSWQWWIVAAAIFIVGRALFFQYRIWYLKRMRKRWAATVFETDDASHIANEDMPQLRRVLLGAQVGIEDIKWPMTEPVGIGYVSHRNMSLIDNLCWPNEEVIKAASVKWGEAIGAYRMKRNDTLNPVQWVISLWELPKSIAGSLGADSNAWPVRLIQLTYQAGVVVGLVSKAWQQWSGVLK